MISVAAVRFAVFFILSFIAEMQSADYKCGIQSFEDKIIGGNVTAIDEYPWTALIRYKQLNSNTGSWSCGGSLVGKKSILTAAHCVDDKAMMDLGRIEFVRLGEYDYDTKRDCVKHSSFEDCTDDPIDIEVTKITIHPDRHNNSKLHDIAILTLEAMPPYTDFIRPICLPDQTLDDTNKKPDIYYVAGWGSTIIGPAVKLSSVKMAAEVNPVNGNECRHFFPTLKDSLQLCAGGEKDRNRNACKGDSGGPLMYIVNNKWTLAGVVSFGPVSCGGGEQDGAPTVFTRISSYLPWIERVLGDQE